MTANTAKTKSASTLTAPCVRTTALWLMCQACADLKRGVMTMAEYIERDTAIKRIKEYALSVFGIDLDNSQEYAGRSLPENYCEGLYEATELIDDLPAAYVAPVRHGKWLEVREKRLFGEHYFLCSNCKSRNGLMIPFNYCNNCGCKMDG